ANIKIVQGMATVEELHLEGPTVRVSLGGAVSIPSRELDLKGTASLVASDTATGFELPFVVLGSLDKFVPSPDPQALIRRSGPAQPLWDAVRDRKPRDAVRSAIERLTGGPRPAVEAQPADPPR